MRRYLGEVVGLSTEGESNGEGEEEEEGFSKYISFGVIALAIALGILTRTTLAKWLPIPYTVLLLLWGGVFGAIFTEVDDPFNEALNNGIRSWLNMDPRVLQIVFFPILIFASAFNAQFHILERRLPQILFLALPGVIMGAGLTATFMKVILPYDWDWNLCWVFGSMVAATDPVAVVALLEELGVSEKLGTLIEGESLLNDGSAIVVFEVFLEAVEGKSRNWHEVLEFGARLALGGPAIGATMGLLGAFVLGYVINDALVEVSLTVLLAFCTFALCEATAIKVSGVLGIVACGVVLSYYGKPRVSSPVLPSLMDFWKTLQFFADTTIFFLSGLIVIGVAVNEERAINIEDFGYLLALFVALYVIRGFVILTAYPVLRSGEYKISVPQMMVLTHSGLRGAVALILALVVDGVHEIEQEQRDKIVFHTAGIAVLSLLVNGTTTGPLVRFLKLDRASEASESVFGQACFALELSMQKQEQTLKEDPFLGDANWSLVWRYLPLFTSESYWTRLSKGHITLSSDELDDIREANSRANCKDGRRSFLETCKDWVRNKKGGFSYAGIPYRLRSVWYGHHSSFLFNQSGGESVWGELESFLANHTAGDDSGEAWTGHLKHSLFAGGAAGDGIGASAAAAKAAVRQYEEEKSETFPSEQMPPVPEKSALTAAVKAGAGVRGATGTATAAPVVDVSSNATLDSATATTKTEAVKKLQEKAQQAGTDSLASSPRGGVDGASEGSGRTLARGVSEFFEDSEGSDDESASEIPGRGMGGRRRSLSKRMFQRTASMALAAGMPLNLTESTEGDGVVDKSELLEARLRFLCALKAEYFKAKREGKLGSSGLRVLTEAINNAHDKVDKGGFLDGWSELSGRFASGWEMTVARYMNWWPARPVAAAAIARRVSFQIDLAWNFLEAHHESNLKSLLADKGQVSKVQRIINSENQHQIDCVEDTIADLTVHAPMVMRSVKTRTAARIMIQRYREATELLAENGHLDEKEEEVLMMAVTEGEMMIAYHPNLEELPELWRVLEKVEFLSELTSEERQRLMDVGAAFYHQYVGEVRLTEMGMRGARGTKRNAEKDFSGWFYVVRGQVEKEWKTETGEMESATHSAGLLFGITDTLLDIPHHAGYTTHGFSNLVVFDRTRLVEEAKTMPALDVSLWKSVAAHSLRRSIRFHKFRLQSCHSLMDRAVLLSGKTGPDEEETIEMAADDAIVLVRGKVVLTEGNIACSALGQADTSVAPILLEPLGQGVGGTVRVSGDYKAFKMPSDMLMNFAREERGRMNRQETMKVASMTLSSLGDNEQTDNTDASARSAASAVSAQAASTPHARNMAMTQLMEQEMDARFGQHARTASVGVKAAMRLMTGLKRNHSDGGPGFNGNDAGGGAKSGGGVVGTGSAPGDLHIE